MNKLTDFNDLRDPCRIVECIDQAQPVAANDDSAAERAGGASSQDAAAAIQRLAGLGSLEYDQMRKREAKALGIRPSTLDAEVEKVRTAMHRGQENPLEEAAEVETFGDDDTTEDDGTSLDTKASPALRADGVPRNFSVTPEGVFWRNPEPGPKGKIEVVRVCSELYVKALVRDSSSENWGRVLELKDADGITHRWVMPMAMLAGDGLDLR